MSVHDDPVVVDNGPVRVDFGRYPAVPDRAQRKFTRAFWGFKRIVVAVVDSNGVIGRVTVHDLDRGEVTFRLEDRITGAREALRFEVSWGKLTVTQEADTFELTKDGLELKARDGRDPRIEDIQQNQRGLIGDRARNVRQKDRTVVATLIPKGFLL